MSQNQRIKILVTGRNGQLGSELYDLSTQYNQWDWVFVGREAMDLTQSSSIIKVLDREQPQYIVNAAAYTAVDKAESDIETAESVNTKAVQTMAIWAEQHQAKIIHISTDYVFDGTSADPLTEEAPTKPINVYGKTKREGELALENSGAEYLIIRTAWVYSTYGANFVKTMVRLMTERDEIGVVSDQIGAPTYAKDLASAIATIIDSKIWNNGIYHYSNEGEISWYDFAKAIQEEKKLDCKVNAIESSAFPTPAKRPHYSLLNTNKIKEHFELSIPEWKVSLKLMLEKI